MKTLEETLAIFKRLKGEPAPAHVYDTTGLGHKAIEARARRRYKEWNEGDSPLPYNDELPF